MTPEDLARDFADASRALASDLFDVYKESGEAAAKEWADAEKAISGARAKHYVKAISSEMKIGLDVKAEVGPDASKRQGKMTGFELGSEHSPPHLTGLSAVEAEADELMRRADRAIADLLP